MSGAGQTSGAPTFLTPIAVDQPIGRDAEGRDVGATMYFSQMIQRILSYLGQPAQATGGGGSGGITNLTVSQQLTNIQNEISNLRASPDAATVGLAGRVSYLESMLRDLLFRPQAPIKEPWPWTPAPAERRARAWFPTAPTPIPDLSVPLSWLAGQNPNNLVLFTAQTPVVVAFIGGRLEIAQGAAATLSIVKAASGTALSGGTALHTGSFNANGTPATNQTLTLAAFATVALAAGDSIGVQTTGTWTTSTGSVTIAIYKPT